MLYFFDLLCYTLAMEEINYKFDTKYTRDSYRLTYHEWQDGESPHFNRHIHPFYEILFILEGELEYTVEDRQYLLTPGDVIMIKPTEYHFGRRVIKAPYKRFCLHFDEEFIKNGRLVQRLFDKGESFKIRDSEFLTSILTLLSDTARDETEADEKSNLAAASSIITTLLVYLDRTLHKRKKSIAQSETNFQKILNYVNSHLTKIHSVEDISEALFFSSSYIMHLFKEEMGVGIMQYIRNKKVLLAHGRIREGGKPTEIYTDCGFSNYPTFYRDYRKYFGFSPKQQ